MVHPRVQGPLLRLLFRGAGRVLYNPKDLHINHVEFVVYDMDKTIRRIDRLWNPPAIRRQAAAVAAQPLGLCAGPRRDLN